MGKFNKSFDSHSKKAGRLKKISLKRDKNVNFSSSVLHFAAKVVELTKEGTVGFKYAFSKVNIDKRFLRPVYGVTSKVMNKWKICEELIEKSGILQENPDVDKNLLRVVIVESLWGHKVPPKQELYQLVKEKKPVFDKLLSNYSQVEETEVKVFFGRVNSLKSSLKVCLVQLEELGFSTVETPTKYNKFLKGILALQPNEFMVDFHFKELFVFSNKAKSKLISNSIIRDHHMIIQSKSSLIPVELMDIKPGDTVLDMCAAPGMKTSIIAARLQTQGKVWAVDKDKNRFNTMVQQLKQFGALKMVTRVNSDVLELKANHESFNLILLDAPCSGSGITGRLGETDNNEDRLRKLQWVQMKLLTEALTKYPNVKRIVYSTCSIYPEENEAVVDQVMDTLGSQLTFRLVDSHQLIQGFLKGSDEYQCGPSCIRVSAEHDHCNGFFVAVFDKVLTKGKVAKLSKCDKKAVKRKHPDVMEEEESQEEEEEGSDDQDEENGSEEMEGSDKEDEEEDVGSDVEEEEEEESESGEEVESENDDEEIENDEESFEKETIKKKINLKQQLVKKKAKFETLSKKHKLQHKNSSNKQSIPLIGESKQVPKKKKLTDDNMPKLVDAPSKKNKKKKHSIETLLEEEKQDKIPLVTYEKSSKKKLTVDKTPVLVHTPSKKNKKKKRNTGMDLEEKKQVKTPLVTPEKSGKQKLTVDKTPELVHITSKKNKKKKHNIETDLEEKKEIKTPLVIQGKRSKVNTPQSKKNKRKS